MQGKFRLKPCATCFPGAPPQPFRRLSRPKTATSPTQIGVFAVDDRRAPAHQKDMCFVGEASNGHEAIEQFRSHRPEVTLVDLLMPEMNGIERSRGSDLS